MDEFLKKVMEGNGITPPENILEIFNQNFKDAVNIEWFNKTTYFEAIFYKENLEYIAIFDKEGEMMEYKMYLPSDYLPWAIKNSVEGKGEIMNAVLKNKGNSICYEIIIRDKSLKRSLILFSDLGKVIEKKVL